MHDVLKHNAGRGGVASHLAVPSPRTWRESSNPVNEFTIGESHGISFTHCMPLPAYPSGLACARADARKAAAAHHRRAARCRRVCAYAATVRPDRGWGAGAGTGAQVPRRVTCCASRSRVTKTIMDQGGLVSDDIMVDTIRERLEENAQSRNGVCAASGGLAGSAADADAASVQVHPEQVPAHGPG